jgi:hypothetical protein
MTRFALTIALALSCGAAHAQAPLPALPLVQNWVRFTDSQERAFSIEVPAGWQVRGGTARWNALQYRLWLSVVTPDGRTRLGINDPAEPFYTVPTPVLSAAGFREGSTYSPTGVTFYKVARYEGGASFAARWGRGKLAALCGNVQMVMNRAQPELSSRLTGMSRDAGEAAFTCAAHGVQMTAYVQATVASVGDASGGLWWADPIVSFIAPSPMAGIAAGVVAHMLASVRIDPAWMQRQGETNRAVSDITTRSNAAISDIIMRGWAERGAIIDRVMEEGSRARLGIDVYSNPATGTRYVVPSGHNYYWVNPSGTVVGTNTADAPKGFSRLSRVLP